MLCHCCQWQLQILKWFIDPFNLDKGLTIIYRRYCRLYYKLKKKAERNMIAFFGNPVILLWQCLF